MPIIPAKRRVGLSKTQHPPQLLRRLNNRETNVSQSKSAKSENQSTVSEMSRAVKIREPKSITALPESSEDEDYLSQDLYLNSHDSDSDVTKSQKIDIKPTVFSNTQTSNGRRNARDRSDPSSQGKLVNRSQNDEPSSSAGSKRHAEDSVPETSSHLTNAYGFTTKQKKKRVVSYGNKSSQPRSSQPKSSQKSAPRSSANNEFKRLELSPSPESSRPKFIKPEIMTPEKTGSSVGFIKLPSVESSPSREHQRPAFRHPSLLSDESPEEKKPKLLGLDKEQGAKTKKSRKAQTKVKVRKNSPEPKQEESSQRPVFKLYSLDDVDYLDDSDDKFTPAFENNVSDDEAGDTTIDSPVAVTTRCPMCREVVDAELLEKFSDRGRMNIRKQAAFCRLHKRHTALNSRSQQGYPKINWGTINKRCEKHHDFLKDILEGTQQSHYRDVLREKVESGKNRTLLKTQDSLTPGYYGPRGLRAMTEYIMRTLSSIVRKRAVEDRLVSARGYTGYVQTVLVPELAVRLIMEDMSVAEADAQKIMHDSIEVGELLYEDVGDVIPGLSDGEDR
ncbi:hypothetical protein F4818DRAFT_414348 [Hypoxylon cercidicola]|nr:hypothetical protein F4818DRAFT_414348 [Hypoxylon cercidicola]